MLWRRARRLLLRQRRSRDPFSGDGTGRDLYFYIRNDDELGNGIYRRDLENRRVEIMADGDFRLVRLSPDRGWFAFVETRKAASRGLW